MHLTSLSGTNERPEVPSALPRREPSLEDEPIPIIARSLRLRRADQLNVQDAHLSQNTSLGHESLSFHAWVESHPQSEPSGVQLMQMAHNSMMEIMRDMPDTVMLAFASPLLSSSHPTGTQSPAPLLGEATCSTIQIPTVPCIKRYNSHSSSSGTTASSPSSRSSASLSSFNPILPPSSTSSPSQSLSIHTRLPSPELIVEANASYLPATSSDGMPSLSPAPIWNHLDPLPEDMRYGTTPSSSSSLPQTSEPPPSSFRPVYPAIARVGIVPQAIILWLIHHRTPGFVASLVEDAVSLTDPDYELGDLVLRALKGKQSVPSEDVDRFETMAYNYAMR